MGFSEKAVAILEQNLNMGSMDQPSITKQHQGSCGDILFLFYLLIFFIKSIMFIIFQYIHSTIL
jgi:hypothetical protein